MALYEDDTQQTPWDKELSRYTGGPGESIGTITNETTGESTTVNRTLPVQPMTQGQPNQTGNPPMGDFNQFMDWVIKTKIGFNPYTMNPTTEALNTWNQNESDYFNKAFAGTGMSPGSMTPEGLKHWNEQKKEGMAVLLQEARDKQNAAILYLKEFKDMWEDEHTVTDKVTIDPKTGEQVHTNKFGKIIKNPNIPTGGEPSQMVSGPGAPSTPGATATTGGTMPQSEGLVKPKTPKEPKLMSQESITSLSDLSTTYDRLIAVGKALATKPDISGPLQGRLAALRVKYKNEGETQAVLNQLNSLITIAYGLSGKQISKEEMELLQKAMLPSLNQPSQNLMATIAFARDWVAETHNKRLEYQTAAGYTHGIKPIAVGGQEKELPQGFKKDAKGNVYNEKGQKMRWRD